MSQIDRREFLRMSGVLFLGALTSGIGCGDKNERKTLFDGATPEEFNAIFDDLFASALAQGMGEKSGRVDNLKYSENIVKITFDGGRSKGVLTLEKFYYPEPDNLGVYTHDQGARTIMIQFEEGSTVLVSSWSNQNPIRLLPPEEYLDRNIPSLKPHEMSNEEIGKFLAQTYATFNSAMDSTTGDWLK